MQGKYRDPMVLIGVVLALVSATSVGIAAQDSEKETGRVVVLAAIGPAPHVQTATDDLADYLRAHDVDLNVPDTGGASRSALVEKLRMLGNHSLLYITVDIGAQFKDRLKVECFDSDGKRLWEEHVSNSFGFTPEAVVKKMLKKIEKKLNDRIGGPGLPTRPKTGQPSRGEG